MLNHTHFGLRWLMCVVDNCLVSTKCLKLRTRLFQHSYLLAFELVCVWIFLPLFFFAATYNSSNHKRYITVCATVVVMTNNSIRTEEELVENGNEDSKYSEIAQFNALMVDPQIIETNLLNWLYSPIFRQKSLAIYSPFWIFRTSELPLRKIIRNPKQTGLQRRSSLELSAKIGGRSLGQHLFSGPPSFFQNPPTSVVLWLGIGLLDPANFLFLSAFLSAPCSHRLFLNNWHTGKHHLLLLETKGARRNGRCLE